MNKYTRDCVKGFLHAEGTRLVNGDGEEVILRGMGVGNWTVPEGFMIGGGFNNTNPFAENSFTLPARFERGRTMHSTIAELCGRDYADHFEECWYLNYLREPDIEWMAKLGFNSVRLPVASRILLKEGPGIHFNDKLLSQIDSILDWCEKYHLYAILDLHAAPAGQSGLGCDDGLDNTGHFFSEPESRERGMVIWETLAKRYADRWIVGGYDLLNEPLSTPSLSEKHELLKDFYDECIKRVRVYDKNHLFTLEGAVVSSDFTIFDHDYDPECHNWCVHVHQYRFDGDVREIYPVLTLSKALNVPVWYGEGGSTYQADAVFYDMISYYGIGFNRWCWKASAFPDGGSMGLCAYRNPEDFDKVSVYFSGGPRPTYEEAIKIFDEILENIKMENCSVNYEMGRYVLHQQGITLPAAGYAHGYPEDGMFSGGCYGGNAWAYRTDDHTRLILKDGLIPKTSITEKLPGFKPSPRDALSELLLELHENDFTTYVVRDVTVECPVTLKIRVLEDADLQITEKDGKKTNVSTKAAPDFFELPLVTLMPCEDAVVRIQVLKGKVQIESITFAK